MDIKRINNNLWISMLAAERSLDIDNDQFLNKPEIFQKERADFFLNNPVAIPDTINVSDIEILSSDQDYKIRLHIYQSKNYQKDRVILFFHGGGYVFGLPEQVDSQMFYIAEKLNATIVSVDYRLSPQFKYPIPIQDGFDAFNWLIQHGQDSLGLNVENITLYGASAGGHLAGKVAQMAIEKGINNIKHQFLLYPVVNFRFDSDSMEDLKDATLWTRESAKIARLHFLGEEYLSDNPTIADLDNFSKLSELPRTTIVACELDSLRDEAINYAQLLLKAQVPTELWVVPGAVHVFDVFSSEITNNFNSFLLNRLESHFQG